jgi:hypothetical protein
LWWIVIFICIEALHKRHRGSVQALYFHAQW